MYDEKFPTAIVKAQVDIINVFLVFASIIFIEWFNISFYFIYRLDNIFVYNIAFF